MYIEEDNKMFLKNLITIEMAEKMKNIGFREICFLYFYKRYPDIFYFELDKMENNYEGTHKNMEFVGYNDSLQKVSIFDYETAFKWFRDRKIYGNVNQEWEYGNYNSPRKLTYFYVINDCRKKDINKTEAIVNGGFDNYEEAREELVKTLIQTYKKEQLLMNKK